MLGSWTFGRKIALGFALAALALVAMAVTGYRATQRMIDSDALVAHTHVVQKNIADLLTRTVDAETGERGYAITGDEEFLEPYRLALPEIDREYRDLRVLTADNPMQQQRLDVVRGQLDKRLAELANVIEARRTAGADAATKLVSSGHGRAMMVEIRRTLGEMDAEEGRLLELRARAQADTTETTTAILLWGSLTALIVIALIGLLIARSLSRQVGSAVQQVQSSSAELQAAANQQVSGASEQATAMSEISTTITELLATSRQIAESAQRVSQIATQTAMAARMGDATVVKGNEASATVRRQVDQIVTHMLELGKRSQQVGSVLDLVGELAEQTNILAINATIEAAGAGEAGRRFGVVADEIRKLADRVQGSTKDIRAMVDDVRGAVNTTVMATEAGSKAVDSGAAQVQEMATAFRQIASLIVTATDAAREIELSTKQQTTAVEQVNIAISNVAQAARETEASATQTLQTSAQLTMLSSDLLKIVSTQAHA